MPRTVVRGQRQGRVSVKIGFERLVRTEMRLALDLADRHGVTPVQYASRRASGLRQPPRYRGQAQAARAASVAASRLAAGESPEDCKTCGNTGIHPRSKRVQALIMARGLPVMACLDCDRTPEGGGDECPAE